MDLYWLVFPYALLFVMLVCIENMTCTNSKNTDQIPWHVIFPKCANIVADTFISQPKKSSNTDQYKHQCIPMHISLFSILALLHPNKAWVMSSQAPPPAPLPPPAPSSTLANCVRGILAYQAVHVHCCRIKHILLLLIRQFLSVLWQPNFLLQH